MHKEEKERKTDKRKREIEKKLGARERNRDIEQAKERDNSRRRRYKRNILSFKKEKITCPLFLQSPLSLRAERQDKQ